MRRRSGQRLKKMFLEIKEEILVVPGVDVSWPGDIGGLGEKLFEFRQERAVRIVLKAGSQNGRQFELPGRISRLRHIRRFTRAQGIAVLTNFTSPGQGTNVLFIDRAIPTNVTAQVINAT